MLYCGLLFGAQLKVNGDLLAEAQRVVAERAEQQRRLSDLRARESDKARSLDRLLDSESEAELLGTLGNFESTMVAKTNELRALQRSVDSVGAELVQLRAQNDAVNVKLGAVASLQDHGKQLESQIADTCTQIARKHAIASSSAGGMPKVFFAEFSKEVRN